MKNTRFSGRKKNRLYLNRNIKLSEVCLMKYDLVGPKYECKSRQFHIFGPWYERRFWPALPKRDRRLV